MKEKLIKLIEDFLSKKLDIDCGDNVEDYLAGRITAFDLAHFITDQLELERRGNRRSLTTIIEKFGEENNIIQK